MAETTSGAAMVSAKIITTVLNTLTTGAMRSTAAGSMVGISRGGPGGGYQRKPTLT